MLTRRPKPSIYTNQIFVDIKGNDDTGDGSVEKPYKTPQKAHDVTPEGIVINLGAGLFTGNITITKPSIIWIGKKLTLINGLIDISGSAGYGNFFKDISLQDIGSGIRNALTVHTGAHAVLINSEIEANAEVGSRCIKVDGGQVDLVTTTMVENASNPITIDGINSATVNAMGSMLTGVSIPVGSSFNHFGTMFERADSSILGTELNDYIASEIINDSSVEGDTVKNALDTLNNEKAGIKTGSYTGDGTGSKQITGLGFQPKAIFINHAEELPFVFTSFSKTDNDGLNTAFIDLSTPRQRYAEGFIVSLDADGFTVSNGADANGVNGDGRLYTYIAYG